MAKKRTKFQSEEEKIMYELGNLKYKELQAEVIMRGMDPKDVVAGDHGTLGNFFIKHHNVPRIKDKLKEFEDWVDAQLAEKGYKKDDPVRKFRKFTTEEETQEKPPKKEKTIKIPKPKRTKSKEFGIFTGTKKEETYRLTKDLYKQMGKKYTIKELAKKFGDQLFQKVKKKFPEAQEKSVKIWVSRVLNTLK